MTYKMPERIDAAPPKITQGTTMLGNWTVNQSTHIQTEYIRADIHAKQMEFLAGWIHGLTGKSVEEILALTESPIVEVE